MTNNEKLNIIFSGLSQEVDNADEDTPLYENKIIDSFDVVRLITEIELQMNIKIDLVQILKSNFSKSTIRQLVDQN
jgi:acyl carrier protein